MFIEIDKKTYIEANDILYIFSSKKNTSINSLKKEAKKNKVYFGKMDGYETLIVTKNKTIFAVNYKTKDIIKKCNLYNHKMLVVSNDYYIAVPYIDALVDLDSPLASGQNQITKATDSLQLVYQGERRKSVAMMKTKEIVYLSKDSEELVNSVSGGFEDTFGKKAKK